ncbi:MAG: acetyl-CoA C-acetyltransferase [Prosthecobacter sp.]|jgi:acetyl-CoA C-acetyltransferase|uniref:thiolase family protein n=1 Tax=Prosthecobacter sp. TaxID=1965333 RepID=UPI001A0CD6B5|nr:acetyl-CoA C-acetyltransferase [Prosthecobacter sp.]MBE2283454.1 acetyl-CoA C-acetyltransferase [Prosthecobacter sp.]
MKPVYIIEAKRTPIGRFGGGLKDLSATDLGFALGEAILAKELRPHIQQVILGQVLQAGAGMNVARQIGLKLGLPQEVPAFTVNMACGSSLKAVALAADAIRAGESDLVLAGGVESMSRAPHYAMDLRWGKKLGDSSLRDAMFVDGLTDPLLGIGMGETAERIADRHGITRQEQDAFAALSQSRVAASRAALAREIVPVGDVTADEHPRADTTVESLAKLKAAFRKDGTVTAGNASGINDGAALVLVAGEEAVARHALKPRARIIACAAVGCDPAVMGLGPVGAIRKLCAQTGWNLDQVDAIEINEAFAVQTLGCAKELNLDTTKLNPRGGAIALGHPIGASGARVLVTLLHHLEGHGLKRGIASLCIGGGMGIAMAVERV